ncbi:uncharacterized protein LAJ45_05719 [Morchella importuna]|uniref:uncharacterized protein n=1 Tax=Morchella importuna TaxID=1174673 RepID=UPI001E8E5314|nr:uncharacterized protein LAJ45_05719 [Morchella importuna]KAH8150033.1 hypothetical protein LAJ45_05719 [Morchella importuna]
MREPGDSDLLDPCAQCPMHSTSRIRESSSRVLNNLLYIFFFFLQTLSSSSRNLSLPPTTTPSIIQYEKLMRLPRLCKQQNRGRSPWLIPQSRFCLVIGLAVLEILISRSACVDTSVRTYTNT